MNLNSVLIVINRRVKTKKTPENIRSLNYNMGQIFMLLQRLSLMLIQL